MFGGAGGYSPYRCFGEILFKSGYFSSIIDCPIGPAVIFGDSTDGFREGCSMGSIYYIGVKGWVDIDKVAPTSF